MQILIIKTGAMGDVLRTTSILPGLSRRFPEAKITWLTAAGSQDLLRARPELSHVETVDLKQPGDLQRVREALSTRAWERVYSFDDERAMCELARAVAASETAITGAFAQADGSLGYSRDSADWFGMGLLSEHGKEAADRLKLENTRSHPQIFASMLGIEEARASLDVGAAARGFASEFLASHAGIQEGAGPLIGLNTGAGGRWVSKRLPVERVVQLARLLDARAAIDQRPTFLLLGGPAERLRNQAILEGLDGQLCCIDAGVEHPILHFAALVASLDLLVTSDSLGLHLAVAARVPVVAFFAPTSPTEIEIYGCGEKLVSDSPDAGSYRPDVDTSSLTAERLAGAVERVLGAGKEAAS